VRSGPRLALAAVAASVLATAGPARADDPLEQCVEAAVSAIEEGGARRVGETAVGFLDEGDSHSVELTLEEETCVGVLAVGHHRVHDLDLVLHTDTGLALEQDVEVDARPYIRFCGAEGLSLVATVHMYAGRGEFRVVRFVDAPPTLPDLNRTVGRCFATAGGMRRPPGAVGPEPEGRSVAESMAALTSELGELGYRPHQQQERGSLGPRQRDAHGLRLEGGRCYAAAAAGGEHTLDLDVFVRTPAGREVARDVARDRNAVARLCVESTGVHVVEVRMYHGRGDYALQVFVLDEPPGVRPPGLEGRARVAHAEVSARMDAHALSPRPLAWGMIGPGQALYMPVQLTAGRCYAFGGVPADEMSDADLDLILLDDEEELLGWDLGRESTPIVYHCAERTGTHLVVGRVYGALGRYLVLVGEER